MEHCHGSIGKKFSAGAISGIGGLRILKRSLIFSPTSQKWISLTLGISSLSRRGSFDNAMRERAVRILPCVLELQRLRIPPRPGSRYRINHSSTSYEQNGFPMAVA